MDRMKGLQIDYTVGLALSLALLDGEVEVRSERGAVMYKIELVGVMPVVIEKSSKFELSSRFQTDH